MSAPSLGGVLATRQGSLLLAVLCAVLAAAVFIVALGRVKSGVTRPIPQATVLIATGEIDTGMSGAQIAAQHLYKSTPVTATQVSAGALSDASQIAGATASANVLPGQQLTAADFGTVADVAQALKPDQRGVEVTISESPGAVDISQAGSRVDVYATGVASASSSTGSAVTSPSAGAPAGAVLLATNVLVLKPATALPVRIGNTPVSGSSLVLAVSDGEVRSIITDSPNLYLALRPLPKNPAVSNPTAKAGNQ
jgi:Flp pilus assembly protein CpaB